MMGTGKDMVSSTAGIFLGPHEEYQRAIRAKARGESSPTTAALTGSMAFSSIKNVGKFSSALFKGTMVEMPLAVTEGMKNIPRLYGEKGMQHEPVTDWKIGAIVAGTVSR